MEIPDGTVHNLVPVKTAGEIARLSPTEPCQILFQ